MKKISLYLLLAIIVEGMTYYWKLFSHAESFFFVWGILFLGLFLLELFRIDTSQLGLLRYQLMKAEFKKGSTTQKSNEKSISNLASVNILIFALMFLANVLMFFILVPK